MTEQDIDIEAWKAEAAAVNHFMALRGDFARAPTVRPASSYYTRIMENCEGEFTVAEVAKRIGAHAGNIHGAVNTLRNDGLLEVVGHTETNARVYRAVEVGA